MRIKNINLKVEHEPSSRYYMGSLRDWQRLFRAETALGDGTSGSFLSHQPTTADTLRRYGATTLRRYVATRLRGHEATGPQASMKCGPELYRYSRVTSKSSMESKLDIAFCTESSIKFSFCCM